MSSSSSLAAWLAARTPEQLAELLSRRPDGESPRTARTGRGTARPTEPTTVLRDLVRSARPPREAAAAPDPAPLEPPELARRLLAAGDTSAPRPRSRTGAVLAGLARDLTASEVDRLADAVDTGGRVRIAYRAASGALTDRVIGDPELVGSSLYAWCELRQDERVFTVSRILSVAPVP